MLIQTDYTSYCKIQDRRFVLYYDVSIWLWLYTFLFYL